MIKFPEETGVKVDQTKRTQIAEFGEVLSFDFVQNLPEKWIYPSVVMRGASGTSAELFGQAMTPNQIEKLGLALIKFAEGLRYQEAAEHRAAVAHAETLKNGPPEKEPGYY